MENLGWCPSFTSANLCGPLRLCGESHLTNKFTAEAQRTAEKILKLGHHLVTF